MSALDATEARRQRGFAIAAVTKVTEKQPGLWIVPSQTESGKYWVCMDVGSPTCTCPDFEARSQPCKHVFAVQYVIEHEMHPDGSETVTESVTIVKQTCAERKTYRQDWPAYNAAQTTEKARFQVLLHDLCRAVPEPPRKPGPGRKPVPMADLVFAAAFKVYSTFSGRRFQTDLDEAQAKGHISRAPRYNTVFDAFESEALTPILRSLIVESSRPLKAIEVDFAVDSSGFSTSRFTRWFDQKYGTVKQECDWVKCHVMCGVTTNVVTSVEVGKRQDADSPHFVPLLKATARNFDIREVSADGAFSSYENHEAVALVGGTPFIAFKANATGAQGGLYGGMFHYYSLRRDEFLGHYHKRSNVESTLESLHNNEGIDTNL